MPSCLVIKLIYMCIMLMKMISSSHVKDFFNVFWCNYLNSLYNLLESNLMYLFPKTPMKSR